MPIAGHLTRKPAAAVKPRTMAWIPRSNVRAMGPFSSRRIINTAMAGVSVSATKVETSTAALSTIPNSL